MTPVVSILMPCFNARPSLSWALGSALAQSFDDWELVVVDDGSDDKPEEIIEQANDPRIRLIVLPDNRGRGVARQVALENARGEFIAMLDADDWMYPQRIASEVDVLRRLASVDLVSAGLAIVDHHNEMTGVRMTGDGQPVGPFLGISCPVAHASSMFRRDASDGIRFDTRLRLGEDQDFLIRLLHGRSYLVLANPLYVYSEFDSGSARKSADAQRFRRRTMSRHLRTHPKQVAFGLAQSYVKQAAYRAGSMLGLDEAIIGRRSAPPSPEELDEFARAKRIVGDLVRRRFDPA